VIDVKIEPHRDGSMAGKYDIRAYDSNGDLLVFSNQGYSNSSDAVDVAKRLFGNAAGLKLREINQIIKVDDADPSMPSYVTLDEVCTALAGETMKADHVDLTVIDWEGRGRTEPIR
jgi:hypothetical protein